MGQRIIMQPYKKRGLEGVTSTDKPYPIHLTDRVKQMACSHYKLIAAQEGNHGTYQDPYS